MRLGMIDGLGCVATLITAAILLRGWNRVFSRDARIALLVLIGLMCYLNFSNTLEWSFPDFDGTIAMMDTIEDYLRILIPAFFFFFIYTILQDATQRELRRSADDLRASQVELQFAHDELKQYSDGLEDLVEQRTSELREQNQSLEQTLDNLRATQAQLIQSEQLAVLGRLATGVAHEVNNPLGAIQSAEGMISNSIRRFPRKMPPLEILTEAGRYEQILELMRIASEGASQSPSSREQREFRRSLVENLAAAGIDDPEEIAKGLLRVTGGVAMELEPLLPLLRHAEAKPILEWVGQLANIRRASQIIELATKQASKITFALRSYAHQSQDEAMSPVNISDNIENILTLSHGRLRDRIQVERRFEAVPLVEGHANELAQIWTNLIHNAQHAMPEGGTLAVSIWPDGEEHVVVSIADTGTGIPESVRDRIFDPFFTTKDVGEGCGLGLDIVREIVHRHHGEINVESEEGEGTIFTIRLPVTQPEG